MPTIDDFKDFFADLCKRTGIKALESADTGLVSVRVQDEYNVNFQFLKPSGKILCFVEVADLPKDAGREVYRELLAAGLFGLETAGGHFTLAADTETVVYDYLFDFDPATDDTHSFMADLWSPANKASLDALVNRPPSLRAKRDGNPPATRRELAMAVGRAHPCGMAAVAERILERELGNQQSPIYIAFRTKFPLVNVADLFPPGGAEPSADAKRILAEVKGELFLEIRQAVMNEPSTSDDFKKSPIFRHFTDQNIVKLDYNEGDRSNPKAPGSKGSLRLPERVAAKFGDIKGFFYRTFRLTTADEASVGAVREALANDITRLLGIPAQELSLVRGEYSDGHPKLMLSAKFAAGYKDLEAGFLKDGHAVAPPGADPIEPLGRYKALFLALADRDAIGTEGQNKGLIGGKFFAIDPGYALEGNGPDLDIRDDLSFTDRNQNPLDKRFANYSVFDDDSRFAKFQGVLKLRELQKSERLRLLFADYLANFFAALRERNIIDEKHTDELPARVAREQERVRLDMLERARRAAQAGG